MADDTRVNDKSGRQDEVEQISVWQWYELQKRKHPICFFIMEQVDEVIELFRRGP